MSTLKIKREVVIFIIVGSITVLLDFLVYRSLLWNDFIVVDIAKALGFLVGTVFAYFANRFWTFSQNQQKPGSVWRFVLLYTSTLITNVYANAFGIFLLANMLLVVEISFIFATGLSAVLNFIGMKLFVFKGNNIEKRLL